MSLKFLGEKNPYRYRGYRYDTETGYYYLQSRYYNPEWGRFLNADALVSTGQGLLSYNVFIYCLNNPASNKDDNGFICSSAVEGATTWKDDSNANVSSGYDYFVSGAKAVGGGIVDTIGSSVGKLINTGYRKVCEIKALGLAFRVSVAGESLSKSLGKKALGYVGDIGVGAYSARDSFKKGEVFGGFIDLGATVVGISAGHAIRVGVAALIAVSTPVWAPAAITVGGFVFAAAVTVGIDWGVTKIKDNHYGR